MDVKDYTCCVQQQKMYLGYLLLQSCDGIVICLLQQGLFRDGAL